MSSSNTMAKIWPPMMGQVQVSETKDPQKENTKINKKTVD